jgi:hypothetical protein
MSSTNNDIEYDFNEICRGIENSYNHNYILCVESIFPLLYTKDLSKRNIILLSEKSGEKLNCEDRARTILPSMSICKAAGENACLSLEVKNDLWSFIYNYNLNNTVPFEDFIKDKSSKDIKSVQEITKLATISGFKLVKFEKYKCSILIDSIDGIKRGVLSRLSKNLFFVRQKSLNIINESNYLADKDRKELKRKLNSGKKSALEITREFIHEKYNINAYAMTYNQASKEWSSMQDHPTYIASVIKSCTDRVSSYENKIAAQVKPISGIYDNKHFIIFPFISVLRKRDLGSLIFIESQSEIPGYLISNLKYFTNYYFAILLQSKQNDLLEELNLKIFRLYQEIENSINSGESFDLKKLINGFVSLAFDIILETTNAFSVNLRLLDAESNNLVSVVGCQNDRVSEKSEQDFTGISIKSTKSCVAHVFANSNPDDDGYYIEDINKLKFSSKSGQLFESKHKYTERRTNAKDELCFCIYFKSVPIGVINFESPLRKGLIEDRQFLKKVRASIENYITVIYECNDKQWLARRSHVYQNLHEIQNLIKSEGINKEFRKAIGQYIEVNEVIGRSIEPKKIASIIQERKKYLRDYKKELSNINPFFKARNKRIYEVSFGIKIFPIDNDVYLEGYKYDMMTILYKNLLDNYIKFADLEHDSILVYQKRNSDFLTFKVNSSVMFDEDYVSKLLVEPYSKNTDEMEKAHYGMFIIGMITRHLGGYAHISNSKDLSIKSSLLITIPVRRALHKSKD